MTVKLVTGRGGHRQNAGRKPDEEPKRYVQIRLTQREWDILREIGGSQKVRDYLAPVVGLVNFLTAHGETPSEALARLEAERWEFPGVTETEIADVRTYLTALTRKP